ncbi:methyltransferase [Chitinophaga qingshengii]|uniref:Methyltransferase n=1 Tax=Chitinophaga qingshengii TaxID=1569794 RepID=A0ABR7TKR5_9BACT|nr:methyltransferase [Chitinophaga qingshengii]MBC9930014.1 methyltransferase [Chitinophaga qingshengii]
MRTDLHVTPEHTAGILRHITNHWVSCCVYVAAKLNLADILSGGPMDIAGLAAETGTHPPSLHRVMKLLAANGIFEEQSSGMFVNTPNATALMADVEGSMKAFVLAELGDFYAPWGDLEGSVRTGKTAFDVHYGADLWKFYKTHADKGLNFMKAMTDVTSFLSPAILDKYDFSVFDTIIDVGGSNGALLSAILKKTPGPAGIVFDVPYVVEQTAAILAADPLLRHRCITISGNFFEQVPAGADAYLLKMIIHDWNDEDAIRILSVCSKAMKKESKILIVDGVVPEDNSLHGSKFMDVNMLVVTGGKERTAAEFDELFRRSGLRLTRIIDLDITEVSIVEGEKI